MKKLHMFTAVILVVAIVVAGWTIGTSDSDDAEKLPASDINQNNEVSTNDTATNELVEKSDVVDGLMEVDAELSTLSLDIAMSNYEFSTNTINAKPGDTVEIFLVTNEGNHDFVIDELGVNSGVLSVDETSIVRFTIPDSATGQTYEFYCSVGNHRTLGMVGTLVVK